MTEFTLSNFETKKSRYGIVASMNVRVDGLLTIFGCILMRPSADPDHVHVVPPAAARSGRAVVKLSSYLMIELNNRAAALYTAATGINVRGSVSRAGIMPKVADDVPVADDGGDTSGLARFVGAEVEKVQN